MRANLDLLIGTVDMHVHSGPDLFPRVSDDIVLARQAQEAGMRALVIKCHFSMTPFRATVARKVANGDLDIFGGVVLNQFVGGLNPHAVDVALRAGGKITWMPTLSAENHLRVYGFAGYHAQPFMGKGLLSLKRGISILSKGDELVPEMDEILNLIADSDTILATGHCSVQEVMVLVKEAKARGVKKILVNHPDFEVTNMPLRNQLEIAREGAYLERTVLPLMPMWGAMKIDHMAGVIKEVGVEHSVLATDLGQIHNPSPIEGYRMFIQMLLEKGVDQQEIKTMTRENPKKLLGLQ